MRRRLRSAGLGLAVAASALVVLGASARWALRWIFEDVGEDHAVLLIQLRLGAASDIREHGAAGFEPEFVRATLDKRGEDPWGRDFLFDASPTRANAVRLCSLGADGRPGGAGRDEDFVVWVDLESTARSAALDLPPDGFEW